MNFGTILDSVTQNCISLIIENKETESKQLAKSFVSYVGLKKPLNEQFKVYVKLGGSYFKNEDQAKMFINEVLTSLNGISLKDIKSYNSLVETRFNVKLLKSTPLNEDISNLIKYKTSDYKNEQEYIESFSNIVENLLKIKNNGSPLEKLNESLANSTLKFLQPKHIIRIALNNFNAEFSKLDETDRHVFYTLKSGTQLEKKQLHNKIIKDILTLIESKKIFDKNEDLYEKTNRALKQINEISQTNILCGYDLLSELKLLSGDDND